MTSRYTHHRRTALAAATAVAAAAALMSTTLTTTATAQPADGASRLTAAPVTLSAAARTGLIQKAQAGAAATAQQIGLGAKEKLVVKDVVKDADGTVHTRYERTYARTEGVTRATKAAIKVASLKPRFAAAQAEKQALGLARTAGSAKTAADQAPRKIIWAVSGKPVLAYETVVGGLQDDGTPNQLHVITDAATGKKLFQTPSTAARWT